MGMGMSLTIGDFKRVTQYPKAVITGMIAQMILLPIMAFIVITLFDLDPLMSTGLMILAFCPGGASSNMISFLARADLALSITLTAIVSLIVPFIIPLQVATTLTYFMGDSSSFNFPVLETIIKLLVVTIIPIVIGLQINRSFPKFSKKVESPVKIFSFLFLFLIIAVVLNKNWHNIDVVFKSVAPIAIILSTCNFILGYFVSKLMGLKHKQSTTIGIEVGIQNGTIALIITGTILGNPEMSLAPATYGLFMYFTGLVFVWITKFFEKGTPEIEVMN